jgi:hypothetical protein
VEEICIAGPWNKLSRGALGVAVVVVAVSLAPRRGRKRRSTTLPGPPRSRTCSLSRYATAREDPEGETNIGGTKAGEEDEKKESHRDEEPPASLAILARRATFTEQ